MRRIGVFVLAIASLDSAFAQADFRLTGGDATIFDASREAFTQPLDNLDPRSLGRFFSGDTVFNANWVNASSTVQGRDGLGPLFNARSCSACHFKDGRGAPPTSNKDSLGFVFRLSIPLGEKNQGPTPHPIYGGQLSPYVVQEARSEAAFTVSYQEIEGTYPDGSKFRIQKPVYRFFDWNYGDPNEFQFSPRVAPSVFGLGLLESIPEDSLLARVDESDRDSDGISGRPNWVWSASSQSKTLGRFGWKANKSSLRDQSAAAFQGDIGITSHLFPSENHTDAQPNLDSLPSGGEPELNPDDLDDVVFYLRTLAPPASRFEDENSFRNGLETFSMIGCAQCHTPEHRTGDVSDIRALSHQTIYPFTDLLLHDMGEGLGDDRADFDATGNEWRTPPLWGLGLIPKVNGHSRLLHDGRARSIEEAILWHSGEAESSRQAFMNLAKAKRDSLIEFIQNL